MVARIQDAGGERDAPLTSVEPIEIAPTQYEAPTGRPDRYWARRAFDLALGIPITILALPLVIVAATYLGIRFRANPFFVHNRVGFRGRTISIPKLRTLTPDTHPYADKTVVRIEAPHGFARFLRSSHLDEVPQLLLVLTGRLSLVGPRPRMLAEVADHDDPEFEALRTAVPQGCTGLWQISVEQHKRVSDHPEYDVFYVENHTLRLDLWILWRTALQALGASPITLDDVPRWALPGRDALQASTTP